MPFSFEQRIPMNSASLQQSFTDIYREFFTKHNLVVSTSHVMHWWHAITRKKSLLNMKQKIPTRMYCGVNLLPHKTLIFNYIYSYDVGSGVFVKQKSWEILKNMNLLHSVVLHVMENFGIKQWLEINFLSENQKGHWFGFTAIVCVLIATILQIVSKRITVDELKHISSNSFGPVLEKIYSLSLAIDVLAGGLPSWATHYTTLMTNAFPTIQWDRFDTKWDKNFSEVLMQQIVDINKPFIIEEGLE